MSPPWRKIRTNIEDLASTHHVLMVSGGCDSMFLLDFYSKCGVEFSVIHFQHGIREDDHREEYMIGEWIQNSGKNIPLYVGHGSNLNLESSEAEARDQRWRYVEGIISAYDNPIVVTAHHLNDNVEHAFMNLAAGSPHNKLGMKPLCDFGSYRKFKPLLEITKEDILDQVRLRNIPYIEDWTNGSVNCDRNIWRNVLIPQLMERRNIVQAMKAHLTST